MIDALYTLECEALDRLATVESSDDLARWQADYLGRRGALTALLRTLGSLPAAERPAAGRQANELKSRLQSALEARSQTVCAAAAEPALDVTLPGRPSSAGRLHPITATIRRMRSAFAQMGFQMHVGREVESDEYNFTLLNLPPYHPARDSHDTFYTARPDVVLRTHTSPAQVRAMRATGAPLRAVVPGATYRNDPPDASHNWQFYQMEGMAVGPNIHLTDLLGAITGLARLLFGDQVRLRFRSSYFPVHRAQPGNRRPVHGMRRQRLPAVQGQRLGGGHPGWHDPPGRAAQRRPGPRRGQRLCLWCRRGSHRRALVSHS